MAAPDSPLERAKELARARWGSATPYRLGVIMVEMGQDDFPSPYAKNSRSAGLYASGKAFRREHPISTGG